jgi:cobalt-zinc-cadmium efflux system outer membrane protein
VLELVRLNQRTGHGGVQDVLRLQLELTRLHTDVARIEREQRSSRALLNALTNRPAQAPLGPPEDLAIPPAADRNALATEWEPGLDRQRPEIDAAERAVRRSEAVLEATRRSARFPSVTIGVDYWYMPMAETRHGYGAMVGINLPWLSGRRRDEEREAEQTVTAERQALQSTRNVIRYQVLDASARLDSARQSFTTIEENLLLQARRNLDATQSAYAAGQGDAVGLLDALRAYLQVRIERVRALAELATSQADLERAAGVLTVDGGGAR